MEKSQFRQVKSKKTRKHMVEMLNQRVADLTDLFVQTKLAHFIAYHELFDKLAGHIPNLIYCRRTGCFIRRGCRKTCSVHCFGNF